MELTILGRIDFLIFLFFTKFPNLTHLKMNVKKSLKPVDLRSLGRLEKLKSFELNFCSSTQTYYQKILFGAVVPNLKKFVFTDATDAITRTKHLNDLKCFLTRNQNIAYLKLRFNCWPMSESKETREAFRAMHLEIINFALKTLKNWKIFETSWYVDQNEIPRKHDKIDFKIFI